MPTVPELFAFENAHPRHTSHKEMRIVDDAVASVEGWAVDPMLCRRVRARKAA